MKTCLVVFALPDSQRSWTVAVPEHADVAAVLLAARLQAGDESVPWDADVGIFGEPCERDAVPRDGDRIEIYRALKSDPKESRRARAAARRRAPDRAAARLPTPKS